MGKYNIQADGPHEALRLFVEQFHANEPTIENAAASGSEKDFSWRISLEIKPSNVRPHLHLVKKEKDDG